MADEQKYLRDRFRFHLVMFLFTAQSKVSGFLLFFCKKFSIFLQVKTENLIITRLFLNFIKFYSIVIARRNRTNVRQERGEEMNYFKEIMSLLKELDEEKLRYVYYFIRAMLD